MDICRAGELTAVFWLLLAFQIKGLGEMAWVETGSSC